MLNFRAVYEFLFSSFRIDRDTAFVEKLVADGHRFAILIKRSWVYGAFACLHLVPVALIAIANVFLMGKHFEWNSTGVTLATLLGVNVLYTAITSLRFVWDYRSLRKNTFEATDVHTLKDELVRGDAYFTSLFNQLQTNFFLFIGIAAFYVYHVAFVSMFSTGLWAVADLFCILVQLFLLSYFVRNMINLEMDFAIVVPGKLFYANQKGMYADTQTLDSDKIKTVKSSYPNFVASFFGHGNVEVMTEGDAAGLGTILIEYVEEPEETVRNVNALLSGRHADVERVHNVYLKGIVRKYSITGEGEEFANNLRKFLAEYEDQVKKDYLSAQDEETKREIEEIYAEYSTKKE